MSYNIQRILDEPIIIVDCHNPFDFTEDLTYASREIAALVDEGIETPVYRIMDFHEIEMSFGDLVAGLAAKTQLGPGSVHDERIRTVMVGTHELIQMKAKSLGQAQYGGVQVPLFATRDEALAYCRAQMAQSTT